MPRTAKPPRLYLRERAGREAAYVILDRGREVSTGYGSGRQREAEEAFSRYLSEKYRTDWKDGDPAKIPLADVLTLYAEEVAPGHAHPELVGYHLPPLIEHFNGSCWDVTQSTCRAYVRAREKGLGGRRAVKAATARRELETMGAALMYAYKARKISKPVFVHLPEKAPPKERWLTRSEASRLVAGALGFKAIKFDQAGKPTKWKRTGAPSYHVARFILIALYTGTRHEAVLRLRWGVNSAGGWFDLENGVLYRKGQGEQETRKRRPPAPIHDDLMPHLRRWRALTEIGPCEFEGRLTLRQKTGWSRARENAGLGPDVTPHTLKHTCATWMLQQGVSIWEVAGYLGTSEAVIRSTYGHHATDHLAGAKASFRGRNLGKIPRRA
jgi:integrase